MRKKRIEWFGLLWFAKGLVFRFGIGGPVPMQHRQVVIGALLLFCASQVVAGPLETPTNARLLITGTNQASVMWVDNATGETGYEIQRRTGDAGSWTLVQSPAANATSWTDNAVPASNFVYYRVRTKNGASASPWSNVACLNNPGDSDADGIPDATETTAGLDPSDWLDATADLDGDGVPNAWEHALSTDMADDTSKPTPNITVDPTVVTETSTVKRTITAAIGALPNNTGNPPYQIVVVKGGVYFENISIPAGKRLALLSDGSGYPPEIHGYTYTGGPNTLDILGDAVIDGFRISRKTGHIGTGVKVNLSSARRMVRIVNSTVFGIVSSNGTLAAAGMEQAEGRFALVHTTIHGNTKGGSSSPVALLCNPLSSASPQLVAVNSTLWNPSATAPEVYYSTGTPLQFRNCIIRNGSAWTTLTSDPLLNPQGHLTTGSPAIGAGTAGHGAPWDIDVEARDASPDVGLDEFIDVDADGLPDHYESGGDLLPNADADGDGISNIDEFGVYGTNPTNADSDGDGMDDGDEIAAGSNPLNPDTDDDGMPDGYEATHGLNPTSLWDRLGDIDGDRIPNFWEFKRGTSPSNAASKPSTDWVVNPPLAGTGINKATIQQAVDAVSSTSGYYAVIEVRPGVYAENVLCSGGRRVALLADQNMPPVEIRGSGETYVIQAQGSDFVIDGFRITRTPNPESYGPGLYIDADYDAPNHLGVQTKIVNCFVTGHTPAVGAPINAAKTRLTVAHTTITGNSSSTAPGNGIAVVGNTYLQLINSIAWNPTGAAAVEVYRSSASGVVTVTNSIVRGGDFGGVNSDPLLNPRGLPTASSPAIDTGAAGYVATDYQGEARSGNPDMGADEFVDTDSDGLPDWVETLGATAPGVDSDSDGATSLTEYEAHGTLPYAADTDADGLNDGGEITAGTNPYNPDTDRDKMPDGFEVTHTLDPLNPRDALDDKDGDRIPNVYEWYHSTDPSLNSSKPSPHVTVDPTATQTATVKNTINAALGVSGADYRIIEVKAGTYDEGLNLTFRPVMLLGQLGSAPPILSRSTVTLTLSVSKPHVVIDGFVFKPATGGIGERAIYLWQAWTADQTRIVNCVFSGFTYTNGAAIHMNRGELVVEHCTFFGNTSFNVNDGSAAIYVGPNGRLRLLKSIVWNPDTIAGSHQVYESTPGTVQVSQSIIRGGEHGASSANPLIEPFTGTLRFSSPAIDGAATPTASLVVKDIHGETRDASPDMGADEFVDSDADELPDRWEMLYYGNLTSTAASDTDGDGLANRDEFASGLNPTSTDSDGDGISDLREAMASASQVYTGTTELADDDGDGLSNSQELITGSNNSLVDTNGDGVWDGASWALGINPAATDSDGDGISNAAELLNGTNPLLADTDADGVPDGTDVFPLDPGATTLPSIPGDMTAPAIILTKPPGAVLMP